MCVLHFLCLIMSTCDQKPNCVVIVVLTPCKKTGTACNASLMDFWVNPLIIDENLKQNAGFHGLDPQQESN